MPTIKATQTKYIDGEQNENENKNKNDNSKQKQSQTYKVPCIHVQTCARTHTLHLSKLALPNQSGFITWKHKQMKCKHTDKVNSTA